MIDYTGIIKVYGDRDEEKYFLYLQLNNPCKSWEKKEFERFEDIIDFINQSFPLSKNNLRKIIKIENPLTEREIRNLESNCEDFDI